jgi:toxin ParE1/3/4
MKWRVELRPEVEQDVAEAAAWYDSKQSGLGQEFVREIIHVWDGLEENPFLASRRHPVKNIRWRYPDRFPYRVIYEVVEGQKSVLIAAVIHAARSEHTLKSRI